MTYTAKRVLATLGVWLLRNGHRILQWASDKGQTVVVRIQVFEAVGDEHQIVYEDERGLTEAVMSQLPHVRRGGVN